MTSTLKTFFTYVLSIWCTLGLGISQATAQEPSTKNNIKMVLDIDTGIDDAMALAYAVGSPQVSLLGVVGSYGNVSLSQGLQNTLNLLTLLNKPNIPVYAGASHTLNTQTVYEPDELTKEFHGSNGIGQITLPTSEENIQQESGVDFFIRMANLYKEELTIVAVGPLTNLALAMEKDKTFETKIGRIVIMGGALTVPGNMNHYAEANIYHDPIAARRVLKSKAKITMVGLDVTLRTILTQEETSKWRTLHTPSAIAYADMVDFYIDTYHRFSPALKGCALHDPLAVAVAIDPSLVTTFDLNMEVGTSKDDYGRTTGDTSRLLDEHPNVSVCINVDYKAFNQRFFDILYHLFDTPHTTH